MTHFLSDSHRPNIVPFRGKTVSPWFYIGDEYAKESLFIFSKGHPVCSISSEEDLLVTLANSRPAFILIEATLSWADPIQLIARLSQLSASPILFLMKKSNSKKQDAVIRQAYQAGIFDILYLPLEEPEFREMVDLVLRVSRKVIGY